MFLDDANQAMAEGRHADALLLLLDGWQDVRHPRIANLIDVIGAALPDRHPLPPVGTETARLTWIAIAEADDPLDLERLLAAIDNANPKQSARRLQRLMARRDDPRLLRWIVDRLSTPLWGSNTFVNQCRNALDRLADPRSAAQIRRLTEKMPRILRSNQSARSAAKLTRALPDLTVPEPPLDDDQRAALTQLERPFRAALQALGRAEREEEALAQADARWLSAILADPDADEPRRVYQDVLLERGEPRGEFLALQYARHDSQSRDPFDAVAYSAREQVLLERYQREWLGPLHGAVTRAEFHRGFPERVLLWRREEALLQTREEPEWATVTGVYTPTWQARADDRIEAALVDVLAGMPALRDVIGITPTGLAALLTRRPDLALRQLTVAVEDAYDLARLLPSLHRLRPRHLGLWLWNPSVDATPFLDGLWIEADTLHIRYPHDANWWLSRLDDLPVRRVLLGDIVHAVTDVRRDPDGRLTHLSLALNEATLHWRGYPTDLVLNQLRSWPRRRPTRVSVQPGLRPWWALLEGDVTSPTPDAEARAWLRERAPEFPNAEPLAFDFSA